jgi:hypothetical protein
MFWPVAFLIERMIDVCITNVKSHLSPGVEEHTIKIMGMKKNRKTYHDDAVDTGRTTGKSVHAA